MQKFQRRMVLPRPGPASQFCLEYFRTILLKTLSEREIRVNVAACAVAYRDIIDRNGQETTVLLSMISSPNRWIPIHESTHGFGP
jgi:hypothetical protein